MTSQVINRSIFVCIPKVDNNEPDTQRVMHTRCALFFSISPDWVIMAVACSFSACPEGVEGGCLILLTAAIRAMVGDTAHILFLFCIFTFLLSPSKENFLRLQLSVHLIIKID